MYLIVAAIVLLGAGGVAVAVGNNTNRSANETAVSEETPPVMAEAVEVASINTTERTECEKVSEQKAADNKKSIVGQKVLKVATVQSKETVIEETTKEVSSSAKQSETKRATTEQIGIEKTITGQKSSEQCVVEHTTTDRLTTEIAITEAVSEEVSTEQRSVEQPITEQTIAVQDVNEQCTTETIITETTERPRIWHEPVTEQVWVVDHEAWTETWEDVETVYHSVCNSCGAIITGHAGQHLDESWDKYINGEIAYEDTCVSYRTGVPFETTVKRTEDHPEEGHYETVVIKEGYWE